MDSVFHKFYCKTYYIACPLITGKNTSIYSCIKTIMYFFFFTNTKGYNLIQFSTKLICISFSKINDDDDDDDDDNDDEF